MSRFTHVYEWSLFGSSIKIDYAKTDIAISDVYKQLRKQLSTLSKYKNGIIWYDDPKTTSRVRKLLDHKFDDDSVTELCLVDFKLYEYSEKLNNEAMEGYSDNDKVGKIVNEVIRNMRSAAAKVGQSISSKYPFIYDMSWDMYNDDGYGISVFIYCKFDPTKVEVGDHNE